MRALVLGLVLLLATPLHAAEGLWVEVTGYGFLSGADPDSARRRAQRAWDLHYADALHFLAEDVATFAAAVVAHHLSPDDKTAAEVRLCGVRAAGQIVAMIRRVSP